MHKIPQGEVGSQARTDHGEWPTFIDFVWGRRSLKRRLTKSDQRRRKTAQRVQSCTQWRDGIVNSDDCSLEVRDREMFTRVV